MARKKKSEGQPGKLGAPDHFTGFKLAFLTSKAALYQQAIDSKMTGSFYNKITSEFVAKYRQDEPFNKEPAEDPLEPDKGFDDENGSNLSEEEAVKKSALFTKLRTVG